MENQISINHQTPPFGKQMLADAVCRPILFSTPMVNAIRKGDKLMTRRIVKENIPIGNWDETLKHCPYQIGNILWVRETTCWVMLNHATDLLEGAKERTQFVYKANVHPDWMEYAKEKYGYKWKPSIFMPKDACRLFLEVTDIRIERLTEISEEDAILEGVQKQFSTLFNEWRFKDYANIKDDWRSAISSFQSLWASINGINSWDENPLVWVYSFKVVDCPYGFR